MLEKNEIIKIWNDLNVKTAFLNFSCGGDSMNDMDISFEDEEGNEIENDELAIYLQDEVFEKVEFYECSDGHYQGESGVVTITLNKSGDGFAYVKSSESEWDEYIDCKVEIDLTKEEVDFITNKVSAIFGEEGSFNFNYIKDCILTDKDELIVEELEKRILRILYDYTPEDDFGGGEWRDYYTFETDANEIVIENNKLLINLKKQLTIFREEKDMIS